MTPLGITATGNLHDAMAKTQALRFGGTDCSLPMLDALEKRMPVDCFIILTKAESQKIQASMMIMDRPPTGAGPLAEGNEG